MLSRLAATGNPSLRSTHLSPMSPITAASLLLLSFFFAFATRPADGGAVVVPTFAEPLDNVTVSVGRDALFTCHVKRLGTYGVGWVKADTKAILSIHNRTVTHNPRISVSDSGHTEWHLHIKQVKVEDRGAYMCQINTDPMISQVAFLQVVIPPDFILEGTTGDVMVSEGGTVRLTCNATGEPTPSIRWRREHNHNITLKTPLGVKTYVKSYDGNVLQMNKVTRSDMGAYFCIASNGVPPAISKRIMVSVHFHPGIHVPNQLVAAPVGSSNVTLECNVEAYPRAIHFWTRGDGSSMILTSGRFEVRDVLKSPYEVTMILTIHKFRPIDAGEYRCKAKNSLGDSESLVKVHAMNVDEDRHLNPLKTHHRKTYETAFQESDYDDYYEGSAPGTIRPTKHSRNDVLPGGSRKHKHGTGQNGGGGGGHHSNRDSSSNSHSSAGSNGHRGGSKSAAGGANTHNGRGEPGKSHNNHHHSSGFPGLGDSDGTDSTKVVVVTQNTSSSKYGGVSFLCILPFVALFRSIVQLDYN